MSKLNRCLDYLSTLTEASVLLNTTEYTKFCAIHTKVLDLAQKINFKPCEEALNSVLKSTESPEACETSKNH